MDSAPLARRCPRCHRTEVFESARGWLRFPARVVALYPLWCGGCGRRCWRFCWTPPPVADPAAASSAPRPPAVQSPAPAPRRRDRLYRLLGAARLLAARFRPGVPRCPGCGGARLRRSGKGWVRFPARLLRVYPLRCRDCQARFWRPC